MTKTKMQDHKTCVTSSSSKQMQKESRARDRRAQERRDDRRQHTRVAVIGHLYEGERRKQSDRPPRLPANAA
eukprot:scaffold19795_cov126-Isochrysis_galbana.AAC.2